MQEFVHLCGQSEETRGKTSTEADGPITADGVDLLNCSDCTTSERSGLKRQEVAVYNPNHQTKLNWIPNIRFPLSGNKFTLMTEVLIMGHIMGHTLRLNNFQWCSASGIILTLQFG